MKIPGCHTDRNEWIEAVALGSPKSHNGKWQLSVQLRTPRRGACQLGFEISLLAYHAKNKKNRSFILASPSTIFYCKIAQSLFLSLVCKGEDVPHSVCTDLIGADKCYEQNFTTSGV